MKAVVFDLDGTLLDVREAFFWQFEELSRLYDGAPVARDAIVAAAHGTTEDIVRSLIRNVDVPFEEICKHHEMLRLDSIERLFKLYQGVDELLPILKAMDIRVAALTAGNHLSTYALKRMGIHHHFDMIVDATKVTRSKPDPEGLNLILKELEVPALETVMVGDSVVDILVGKNAGVRKAIGVSHGFGSIQALRDAGADHIISDIPTLLDVLE